MNPKSRRLAIASQTAWAIAGGLALWVTVGGSLFLLLTKLSLDIGGYWSELDKASYRAARIFILVGAPAVFIVSLVAFIHLSKRSRTSAFTWLGFLAGFVLPYAACSELMQFGEQTRMRAARAANAESLRTHNKATESGNSFAEMSIRTLFDCAQHYTADSESSYPTTLAALGPSGTRCVGADLATGQARGWRFTYHPGVPDESGRVHLFTLCAEPLVWGRTGTLTFLMDDRGGRTKQREKAGCGDLASYVDEISGYDVMLSNIKYCLLDYASSHPAEGYPAQLGAIGGSGTGCLLLNTLDRFNKGWIEENVIKVDKRERYPAVWYEPGPRRADGRIATFSVGYQPFCEADRPEMSRSVAFDERGQTHVATHCRRATRDDPVVKVASLQELRTVSVPVSKPEPGAECTIHGLEAADDWFHAPQIRSFVVDSAGRAYVADFMAVRALAVSGRERWHVPLLAVAPLGISRTDQIYAVTESELVVLDAGGRKLWVSDLPPMEKMSAPPLELSDGAVLLMDIGGRLVHVVRDGAVSVWREGKGKFPAPNPNRPVLAANGTVYAPQAGRLDAFDVGGHLQWSLPFHGAVLTPALSSAGDRLYCAVSGSGTEVFAFTTAGKELWWVHLDGGSDYPWGPTVDANDAVYVTTYGRLTAISRDGALKWRRKIDGLYKPPPSITSAGRMYAGIGRSVAEIDRATGAICWKHQVRDGASFPLVVRGDRIYAEAWAEGLAALRIRR